MLNIQDDFEADMSGVLGRANSAIEESFKEARQLARIAGDQANKFLGNVVFEHKGNGRFQSSRIEGLDAPMIARIQSQSLPAEAGRLKSRLEAAQAL